MPFPQSAELNIIFVRRPDVNRRSVYGMPFLSARARARERGRERGSSASYRIKQSGITREPRRINEADAEDSVVQFASQRGQHRYS